MQKFIFVVAVGVGSGTWYGLVHVLEKNFGSESFFGHVLSSPVNLFTFAAFSAAMSIIIGRWYQTRRESAWTLLSLLPENVDFHSFSQLEPFCTSLAAQGARQSLRPVRLLRACYESVRTNWSASAASAALQTEFQLIRAECDAQNHVVSYLVSAIVSIGFIGTVLGISSSMGAISDGVEASVSQLHVAFDTTLVSLVLSLVALFALASLHRYEESEFLRACEHVVRHFILRIRNNGQTRPKRRKATR